MARIRTIKPRFATSKDTARLSIPARLFFLQLLTELDDEGRLIYSPKKLAGVLYPHDEDVDGSDIRKWVRECCAATMLVVYKHGDTLYLWAPTFTIHQKINRPSPSVLPGPCDPESEIQEGAIPEDLDAKRARAKGEEQPDAPKADPPSPAKPKTHGKGGKKGTTNPGNEAPNSVNPPPKSLNALSPLTETNQLTHGGLTEGSLTEEEVEKEEEVEIGRGRGIPPKKQEKKESFVMSPKAGRQTVFASQTSSGAHATSGANALQPSVIDIWQAPDRRVQERMVIRGNLEPPPRNEIAEARRRRLLSMSIREIADRRLREAQDVG